MTLLHRAAMKYAIAMVLVACGSAAQVNEAFDTETVKTAVTDYDALVEALKTRVNGHKLDRQLVLERETNERGTLGLLHEVVSYETILGTEVKCESGWARGGHDQEYLYIEFWAGSQALLVAEYNGPYAFTRLVKRDVSDALVALANKWATKLGSYSAAEEETHWWPGFELPTKPTEMPESVAQTAQALDDGAVSTDGEVFYVDGQVQDAYVGRVFSLDGVELVQVGSYGWGYTRDLAVE